MKRRVRSVPGGLPASWTPVAWSGDRPKRPPKGAGFLDFGTWPAGFSGDWRFDVPMEPCRDLKKALRAVLRGFADVESARLWSWAIVRGDRIRL
jgi:hypothetical protein